MTKANLNPKLNKTILSILILAGLFFVFSFSSANAYTETHYVTQDGAGSKNGRSLANAWAVSQFNTASNWNSAKAIDGKIGPDDVVYFSGIITTQLDLKGSGSAGYPITLDGYEAGDCNPIANGSCSGATVTGGLENTQANHYLTFQDFNITSKTWVFLKYGSESTNLKWLRNNWDNANVTHMVASNWLGGPVGAYWWVEGNRFGNYGVVSNAEGSFNMSNINNLVIRGNYLTGHNGVSVSSNKINFHQCSNILVEYNHADNVINYGNSGQVVFKEFGNQNAIVRFNKFKVREESALTIAWPAASDFFVYGNYFYQETYNTPVGYAIDISDGPTNINIWSNIIANHYSSGLALWYQSGRQGTTENPPKSYNPDRRAQNFKIYNNTFYGNAIKGEDSSDQTGLSLNDSGATGLIVKNNLFVNNRPNSTGRWQVFDPQSGANLILEHNTYFHSGGAPVVDFGGVDLTIATLQSSFLKEDDSPAGVVANPGLNTNMTLNGTHINNGANLSGLAGSLTIHGTRYNMYWETALHPSTDWSGQPNATKIKTADQNSHGSGWERGAYAYVASSNIPGDFDGDGEVGPLDYEIMNKEFMKDLPSYRADMNGKDGVNELDYELFNREYGKPY